MDQAMFCDARFVQFDATIRLDPTRQGRIDSALSAFRSFCDNDDQLSVAMSEPPFLQGSVATKTCIKPLSKDEFDVDVVYGFSLSKFGQPAPGPKGIHTWFLSRLNTNAFYRERLEQKPRCARIDYAGDFHVDIIPSATDLQPHSPYAVPARDLAMWKTNDPKGLAAWVKKIDLRAGGNDSSGDGRFVRCVRIMKRWRDHFFTESDAISSLLLLTFLGKHDPTITTYQPPLDTPLFKTFQNDAAYLFDMLRITYSCLNSATDSAFRNPTIPTEDLGGEWKAHHLNAFMTRLKTTIHHLHSAISETRSEQESIRQYKNALGPSFPG